MAAVSVKRSIAPANWNIFFFRGEYGLQQYSEVKTVSNTIRCKLDN